MKPQHVGARLVSAGSVTDGELEQALEIQRQRPFLHLGEVLCLMGALDEARLTDWLPDRELGSLLLSKGWIRLEQLADALALQASTPLPLGEILIALGFLDRSDLERALSEQVSVRPPEPSFRPAAQSDPAIAEAAIAATRSFGVGQAPPQMVASLEARLAEHLGADACVVFPTRFHAALGALSIVRRAEVLAVDGGALSLLDAARVSGGELRRFHHNNLAHLETTLKQAGIRKAHIAAEAHSADVAGLSHLAERYGAPLILDESYHLHRRSPSTLRIVGFGPCLGAMGACVLGDQSSIDRVRERASAYIESLWPGAIAAIEASLCRQEVLP